MPSHTTVDRITCTLDPYQHIPQQHANHTEVWGQWMRQPLSRKITDFFSQIGSVAGFPRWSDRACLWLDGQESAMGVKGHGQPWNTITIRE